MQESLFIHRCQYFPRRILWGHWLETFKGRFTKLAKQKSCKPEHSRLCTVYWWCMNEATLKKNTEVSLTRGVVCFMTHFSKNRWWSVESSNKSFCACLLHDCLLSHFVFVFHVWLIPKCSLFFFFSFSLFVEIIEPTTSSPVSSPGQYPHTLTKYVWVLSLQESQIWHLSYQKVELILSSIVYSTARLSIFFVFVHSLVCPSLKYILYSLRFLSLKNYSGFYLCSLFLCLNIMR